MADKGDGNVWIRITVGISASQYGVHKNTVDIDMCLPAKVIDDLDPGSIFKSLMQAAVISYGKNELNPKPEGGDV